MSAIPAMLMWLIPPLAATYKDFELLWLKFYVALMMLHNTDISSIPWISIVLPLIAPYYEYRIKLTAYDTYMPLPLHLFASLEIFLGIFLIFHSCKYSVFEIVKQVVYLSVQMFNFACYSQLMKATFENVAKQPIWQLVICRLLFTFVHLYIYDLIARNKLVMNNLYDNVYISFRNFVQRFHNSNIVRIVDTVFEIQSTRGSRRVHFNPPGQPEGTTLLGAKPGSLPVDYDQQACEQTSFSISNIVSLQPYMLKPKRYIRTCRMNLQSFTTLKEEVESVLVAIGALIALGYTPIFRWFYNIYKKLNSINRVINNVDDTIAYWKTKITNFDFRTLDDKFSKRATEVKTMMHVMYHVYNGNINSAIEWASNFIFLEPQLIIAALGSINIKAVQNFIDYSKTVFEFRGVQYATTPEGFNEIADAYERQDPHFNEILETAAQVDFEPQSGLEIVDIFGSLASMFTSSGVNYLSEQDLRLANTQYTYIRNMNAKTKEQFELVQKVISVICRTLFSFDPLDQQYQLLATDIFKFIEYVDGLVLNNQVEYGKDRVLMGKIIDKHAEACTLNQNPRMASIPHYLRNLYMKRFNDLEAIAKECVAIIKGSKTRVEPVFCLYTGGPGVGKTATSQFVMKSIGHFDKVQIDNTSLYMFNSKDSYWEQYKQQKFVIMDELFKDEDTQSKSNEACAILGMVNTSPMPLTMAFGEKGTCFFDSEYIFSTTNIYNEGLNSALLHCGLTDESALRRRFHIVVHRDEKCKPDAKDNTFRIDQCIQFPHLVGQIVTAPQLADIIYKARAKNARIAKQWEYDEATLSAIYNKETFISLVNETVEIKSKPQPQPYSPEEFIVKFIKYMNIPSEYIQPMITTFFVIIGSACTYAVYKALTASVVKTQGGTTHSSQESSYQHLGRRAKKSGERGEEARETTRALNFTIMKKPVFKPQSSQDNLYLCALRKVHSSVVTLHADGYLDGKHIQDQKGMGFHIRDGAIMTTAHFLFAFEGCDRVQLQVVWDSGSMVIPMPQLYLIEGEDMVFIMLPRNKNLPPEGYKYIVEASLDLNIPLGAPLKLLTTTHDGAPAMRNLNKADHNEPFGYNARGRNFTVLSSISYYGNTVAGDSGAVILTEGPQGKPYVIGMHIGQRKVAFSSIGICLPVFKEQFASWDIFRTQSAGTDDFPMEVKETVAPGLAHFLPTHSKIKRVPLFGWDGEPEKIPAKLRTFTNPDGEQIVPLYKAMRKLHQEYTKPTEIPDYILDNLFYYYPKRDLRVLSWDEALNGSTEKRIKSICYRTSPGYPYSLKRAKGKGPYIQIVDQNYEYDNDFYQQLIKCEDDLKQGKQIEVLWADVLKDETRQIEKVYEGKTRLFSTCPLHYLILMRKYFLDFVTYIQEGNVDKPISVGINPHSDSWKRLHDRLASKAKSIVSGDFSNFDGKLPRFVGEVALRFINQSYNDGEENMQIRTLLFEHIFNANHICFDKIYEVKDGNPSGNPITTVYNSLCNIIMHMVIFHEDFGLTLDDYEMAVFGDDSNNAINRFHFRTNMLTEPFKRRFDMDYTHSSKKEVADDHIDSLDNVKFISRMWRYDSSRFRAPLDLKTIIESTYWKKGELDCEKQLLAVAKSFFLELSHHPRDVYDSYSQKFLANVKETHPNLYTSVAVHYKPYFHYVDAIYYKNMYANYWDRKDVSAYYGDEQFITQSTSVHAGSQNVADTNNLQYTERSVNEVENTQGVQLGSYQDAAPVSNSAVNSNVMQEIYNAVNMETFDLNQVLMREYPIETLDWEQYYSSQQVIGSYKFPQALFDIPFLADKLKDFRFFKGGVRFSVRISASKFHYGKIGVFFYPRSGNGYVVPTDLYEMTGSPHVLVSAAASETHAFDAPFICPNRAIDINNYDDEEIGRFEVVVFNPLIDVNGSTAKAQIFITAQFLEAEVFMPHDRNEDPPGFVIQSRSTFTSGTKTRKASNVIRGKEAQRKGESGVISGVLDSFDAVAGALETVPLVQPFASTMRAFTAPAALISHIMGLSKPTTVAAGQINKLSTNFDINYGKGIDTAPKLAMDPENGIATMPIVGGIDQDEMALSYVAGMPMLTSIIQITRTSTTFAQRVVSIGALEESLCFLDFVRQMFQYSSGTTMVKIYITASLMMAVRVVFYLTDDDTDDWTNCYHKVVDIQGDTEVSFAVAYPEKTVALQYDASRTFNVYVRLLSWSQPNQNVDVPIYLNVYKAGGSDYRFFNLLDRTFTPQSNPRADFVQPFEFLHESMKGYQHKSLICGEEYTTVREIVHRYTAYRATSQNTDWEAYGQAPFSGNPQLRGLELWGHLYRFWRGSIRFRMLQKNGTALGCCIVQNNGRYVFGTATSNLVNPQIEVELPYYTNQLFKNTKQTNESYLVLPDRRFDKFVFKAAGDDFSYHFIVGPRTSGAWADSVQPYGFPGFYWWINQP